MPVNVIYDPSCDQNFPRLHHTRFQQWINENNSFTIQDGTVVTFDQAHVLNGLHPTTSTYDPNPVPHVTVRLSTPTLRSERRWYILHWRVDGGSVFLPRPDDEDSNRRRQMRRREKKQRRQERDRMARENRGAAGVRGHSTNTGPTSDETGHSRGDGAAPSAPASGRSTGRR